MAEMQKLVSMENKHGLHTREEFGGAIFQINDGNALDRRIMTNKTTY